MSKDEALEKWLKARPPVTPGEDYFVTADIARQAWHAAVKHTLAFVAVALDEQTESVSDPGDLQDLINLVRGMQP